MSTPMGPSAEGRPVRPAAANSGLRRLTGDDPWATPRPRRGHQCQGGRREAQGSRRRRRPPTSASARPRPRASEYARARRRGTASPPAGRVLPEYSANPAPRGRVAGLVCSATLSATLRQRLRPRAPGYGRAAAAPARVGCPPGGRGGTFANPAVRPGPRSRVI